MNNIRYMVFIAILVNCQMINASVVQMDREEVIQRSEMIFVGQVTSKKSRWNSQGNMIVTDYEFSIREVLSGEYYAENLTLTFAGGQLPEEGHALSGVPKFSVDEKVLLMLESPIKPLFSPVTGVYQGKFSALDNQATVVDGLGQPVEFENSLVTFDQFIEQIKREIPIAMSKALPNRSFPLGAKQYVMKNLPSKQYDTHTKTNLSTQNGTTQPKSFSPNNGLTIPTRADLGVGLPEATDPMNSVLHSSDEYRWTYEHRAKHTPVVFNQLGQGGLLSNHDQFQMSYWNAYANIYQVYVNPSATWAWQNNVYDIAGFVTEQTMLDQFGQGWGTNTLAICFYRWDGTGFSIEADIAVNPAFNWTVDDFATYNNNSLFNANRTLLHELGHAWGLQHQFNQLSVMNYAPHKYRAYTVLYGDDVMAVRTAFPGDAIAQTDFSISLFHAPSYQNYDDATLSNTTIQVGDSFEVSDFVLENSGTQAASTTIHWYLTPNINDWTDAIYIDSTFSGTLNPDSSFYLIDIPLTIPASMPAGHYFLAANINSAVDNVLNNNSSWLDRVITIQGTPICSDDGWEHLGSAGTDDICSGSQIDLGFTQAHLHCDADWVHFDGQAGATYRIETSNLNGGADTTMSIQKECGTELAFDDDSGVGNGSLIDWTVTDSGRYDVNIREFNDNYANGKYFEVNVICIANCNDVIFSDGFE